MKGIKKPNIHLYDLIYIYMNQIFFIQNSFFSCILHNIVLPDTRIKHESTAIPPFGSRFFLYNFMQICQNVRR